MDESDGTQRGGRGGIQSLHRAFDILGFVGRFDVVGATRIATELGLSVSTVNNLCRTMVDRGYLIGRRGQYRIGPAFSVLATRWNPMLALPEIVVPVLQELSEDTGQAAVATVLTGMDARVVAFEQGHGPVGTPPPRADRRALDLPTGTVLVALSRRPQWPEFVTDCVEHAERPLSREKLFDELERVAMTGICGRRSSEPHGQTALAVPVWTAAETVACAIGVSAPTYLADEGLEKRMRDALVDAAQRLSVELGADDVPPVAPEFTWGVTH
ncbi:MAG: helix-turn-helix domain-containing protein [Microbacteriaceae bacterium]|nr:helix-turn-helix domain-containing protein [Microbacteriaceae bacterium]